MTDWRLSDRLAGLLRVATAVSIVFLIRGPGISLYNAAAIVGVVLLLARRGGLARLRSLAKEPALLALLAMIGWLGVSTLLARRGLPPEVVRNSLRGLAGLAACGTVLLFAFLDPGPQARRQWIWALAAAVTAVSLLHYQAAGGGPVFSWLREMGAAPPGEYHDFGSRNVLAALWTLVLPMVLVERPKGGRGLGLRTAAFVAVVGLGILTLTTLRSRTAIAVFAGSMCLLTVLLLWRGVRQWRTSGTVLVAGVAAWLFFPTVHRRPLLLPTHQGPDLAALRATPRAESVAAGITPLPPPSAPVPSDTPGLGLQPIDFSIGTPMAFRIPLTASYQSFEQEVVAQRDSDVLRIHGRSTAACRGTLRLEVDGLPVETFDGRTLPPDAGWALVRLPVRVEAGTRHRIRLQALGDLSPADSYFEISGVRYASDAVSGAFLVHEQPIHGDLSPDPGIQQGTALVLPWQEAALPPGTWLGPASETRSLDQSLSDRVRLWRFALERVRERPLFGWGFYTFGYQLSTRLAQRGLFTTYANAHSQYLQMLHDGGLVGLALFLAAALMLSRAAWVRVRNGSLEACGLAASLAGVLLNSLTQVVLIDQRYYASVAMAVGLLLSLPRVQRPRPAPGS